MGIVVGSDDRSDGPESEADGLSEDQIFSLLSAGRRRAVLRLLQREGEAVPLSEITQEVARSEGIGPGAAAPEYKKVYVSLYQTHVPVLEDAGVVEYDPERKDVRLTPKSGQLFTYLDVDGAAEESGATGLLSRFFQHSPAN